MAEENNANKKQKLDKPTEIFFGDNNRLEKLLKKEFHTDIELNVEDKVFKAHKLILASASPYFEGIFYRAQPAPLTYTISNVKSTIFVKILKYIYEDKLEIETWDVAVELYFALKKFRLEHAANLSLHYFVKNVNTSNALKLFDFGRKNCLQLLTDVALVIIKNKTNEVLKSPNLFHNDINTTLQLFSQAGLQATALELFNALDALAIHQDVFNEPLIKHKNFFSKKRCLNVMGHEKCQILEQFRFAVMKIPFLNMTIKEFLDGPALSKLLTPEESLAISTCLNNYENIPKRYPKRFTQQTQREPVLPSVFLDINQDDKAFGRIVITLRSDVVPKTAENFLKLCSGQEDFSLKGSNLFEKHSVCIYGGVVTDYDAKMMDIENHTLKHEFGTITMYTDETLQSQEEFMICSSPIPTWDNKYVAFGKVIWGMPVILNIIKSNAPIDSFTIVDCGQL